MYSCAVFGHSDYVYENKSEKIRQGLIELIEKYRVTEFWIGLRGNFDVICIRLLKELKREYPNIKLIRVWAYLPQKSREQEQDVFDGSVYLLEKRVPPLYAIVETNKCMVRKADYIFSGVRHTWGGAWVAVDYAKKKGKKVMDALGETSLW